jgi:hypothetical protein
MRFPPTRDKMEEAGYKRKCYTRCQGCRKSIEFWSTPAGKTLPMETMPDAESEAVSHFATCPDAARFRKKTK